MVDYGVYDASDATSVSIPLEQVHVHADIIEDSAVVTVTQEFWQPYTSMTTAKYAFPTPAYAAVCGFKMFAEDGRTITAVAKEKSEAKKTFDRAVATGQTAGVLEHVRDDVFTISLGALPDRQMIKFQLTYAIDLTDVINPDKIEFRVPLKVGRRYGAVPDEMVEARQVPSDRFTLSANICSERVVTSVTSSSHPQAEGLMAFGGETRVSRQSVSFRSPDFLSADFCLSITLEGPDLVSRCLAQTNDLGAMTMRTTIALPPQFPQVSQGQEYIFLLDRSLSMDDQGRIEIARTALSLLLRALPDHDTSFNILSFGTRCESLWNESHPYNKENLKYATERIMSMEADLGGTDIFFALGEAIKRRDIKAPTACFVITDGEVWNLDVTVERTKLAVARAARYAPLRVFTLGIGDTASTELCTRVARAGKGVCLMAPNACEMLGACATLLRASRSLPLYADVSCPKHVPLYVATEPLLPGRRALMYSIGEPESGDHQPPAYINIILRDGNNNIWGTPETVLVQNLSTESLFPGISPHGPRLLGILAARHVIAAIQHLDPPQRQDLVTRIGLTYQLATDFTSFVAVDQLNQTVDYQQPAIESDSDDFKPAQSVYPIQPAISPDPGELTIEELLRMAGWESRGAGQASTKASHTDQIELPTMSDQELPSIDALCASAWPSEGAMQVALMQATDGHFEVSPDLKKIIGENRFAEGTRPDGVSETVWGTVLAVAYLKKYMENVPVYLEALVEKAVEFLEGVLEREVVKQLLEDAECLIG